MRLAQVRECDGQCCKEGPRFPNEDRSGCIYRNDGGCRLMRGEAVPDEASQIFPGRTAADVFQETCVEWPHNSEPRLGKTGGCCWQWIE